ncbi:peroxiredoxin [Mycetocola manganoxydans]|uniref:Alkyl hydroperoxide reductase E n=1 Tax=Mycetocola manganoxydans TaxID=699879 RepID=A0A3L6ZV67_9MICO|nr:peroxiredoxin [Mycetocola manganoxydans]RLP71777.1 peroxiredoxin [Mycetocola manganoxydans]GHD39538.1 peroxiredoxin [Mycetocola manganoxydans]
MALEIGAPAPEFTLPNQFGEDVDLRGFRGKRSVALVFFPLAFSGRCTSELCELRDNLKLFADAGVELIGISVDSKFALRAWAEQEGYDFALLADFWPHGEVSSDYGVFLPENGFANRATFLIDIDGIVRARFITAPGEVRPLAAYRAALADLQSTHAEAV